MKLQEFKENLINLDQLTFVLPNGSYVPPHFHLTEIGENSKRFVDCGGTIREKKTANFQLWSADDFDHRLEVSKVLSIIDMAQDQLNLGNLDIEVEYQSETIGKYQLDFDGNRFLLIATQTDCLAKEKCGIPEAQPVNLAPVQSSSGCSPESGCC